MGERSEPQVTLEEEENKDKGKGIPGKTGMRKIIVPQAHQEVEEKKDKGKEIPGKRREEKSIPQEPQVPLEAEENKDKGKGIPGKIGRGKRSVPQAGEAEDVLTVPMDENLPNQNQIIDNIQGSFQR